MSLAWQEQAGQLLDHGGAQFLRAANGHGTLVVVGNVVTNADGEQLYRRAFFYPVHHIAQMLLEETARIGRQGGFIERYAIGNDQQNAAFFAAREQALVCP